LDTGALLGGHTIDTRFLTMPETGVFPGQDARRGVERLGDTITGHGAALMGVPGFQSSDTFPSTRVHTVALFQVSCDAPEMTVLTA